MPIKPENRARYPKDWSAIRERILKRAQNECERCAVPNGVYRWVDDDGHDRWTRDEGFVESVRCDDGYKVSLIVLTIAHVHDPDPANCADENLQALCQRCHNKLDAPMRAQHAAATRKARKAAGDLFA